VNSRTYSKEFHQNSFIQYGTDIFMQMAIQTDSDFNMHLYTFPDHS